METNTNKLLDAIRDLNTYIMELESRIRKLEAGR